MFSFSELMGAYTAGAFTTMSMILLWCSIHQAAVKIKKANKRKDRRLKRKVKTLSYEARLENAHRKLNFATKQAEIDSAIQEINRAEEDIVERSFLSWEMTKI